MAFDEFFGFFRRLAIACNLRPGAAVQRPVPLSQAFFFDPRVLLAGLTEIDDVGHDRRSAGYFLRKASSETTSALLAASATAGFFSASVAFFFGSDFFC